LSKSIIPFDFNQRLIDQAKYYIKNPGHILQERDKAVSTLLKALKIGDLELRKQLIFLLGSFAKEEIYWPLYEIMMDEDEPDELRDQAAIHLAVIGPFLDDPQGLVRRLIGDIANPDREVKTRAIMALGWEGNLMAAVPLIECMYDEDPEIQELAVNALCNLKDSRLMGLLADRIRTCSFEQKRVILFNLWRFKDKEDEIAAIYKTELESGDPALKLDVLILLGQINARPENEKVYRDLLKDESAKVRSMALERLGELGVLTYEEVLPFLDDSSMDVKRTALIILQQMKDKH